MGTRRRHTPEQIVRKLREGEKLLGQGVGLPEVLKRMDELVDLTDSILSCLMASATSRVGRRKQRGTRGPHPRACTHLGRRTVKVLPWSTALVTSIVPPIAVTM